MLDRTEAMTNAGISKKELDWSIPVSTSEVRDSLSATNLKCPRLDLLLAYGRKVEALVAVLL